MRHKPSGQATEPRRRYRASRSTPRCASIEVRVIRAIHSQFRSVPRNAWAGILEQQLVGPSRPVQHCPQPLKILSLVNQDDVLLLGASPHQVDARHEGGREREIVESRNPRERPSEAREIR